MAPSLSSIKPPLRVACCFGTYPPERNGGADFLGRFAAALAADGVDVTVLTSPADAPEEELTGDQVRVYRIVDDWSLGSPTHARVNALLRERGVHVVHVFFPDPGLGRRYQLPVGLAAAGRPLVTTFWNLGLGRRSPGALRAQAAALLARSSALTSHDPGYLAVLRRLALGRPVHWLPVGSNVSGVAPRARKETLSRFGLDGAGPILGYFGQLDFTRGADDLFEALRLVRANGDARLVMIGSAGREERYATDPAAHADYRRLRGLPARLGIEDAVAWTDYLPERDVASLLSAVDVCVLPYRRNSLGRSALAAALEAGAPTVLAGTPGGVGPLRPGLHVALAPPGDPGALATTIRRVLAGDEERRRLRAGAKRAARMFAWPRIAAAARGIYTEVLCA